MNIHLAFARLAPPGADAAPLPQRASLAARALLAQLLAVTHGMAVLPEIVREAGGRPRFRDAALPAFSLSHSRDRIGVALGGTTPIGLDIELPRPRTHLTDMADALYSAPERDWMASGPALERFYLLWCIREAALKAGGHGLAELSRVEVDPAAATLRYPRTPHGQVLAGLHDGCSWALHAPWPARLHWRDGQAAPIGSPPAVRLRLDCLPAGSGVGQLAADQ